MQKKKKKKCDTIALICASNENHFEPKIFYYDSAARYFDGAFDFYICPARISLL